MAKPRQGNRFPSAEYALLQRLAPHLNFSPSPAYPLGMGDDAAIRRCVGGEQLVLTADSQVEEVHFSLKYQDLAQVGYKAMAVNISDCASMGARPDAALVQVIFPKTAEAKAVEKLYRGIGAACRRWGFPVVGGDLAQGPVWCVAVTMLGRMESSCRPLLRRGAKPGNDVWVSGRPGESGAGLAALRAWGRQDAQSRYRRLVSRHVRPQPRVELGSALVRDKKVTAAIDVSDGISKECRTIAWENRLGVVLCPRLFPIAADTARLGRELGVECREWFLHGGEDYELLVCASRGFVPPSRMRMTRIGYLTDRVQGVYLETEAGALEELSARGWDHVQALASGGIGL